MPQLTVRRREFEDYASSRPARSTSSAIHGAIITSTSGPQSSSRCSRNAISPPLPLTAPGARLDSLTGTIRRLRTDPKAYPNTPKGEQGAEVATQVIRTINDASFAEDLEVECCRDALIHGFGVDELILGTGDKGDPDLRFSYVDPKTYLLRPAQHPLQLPGRPLSRRL